ncbi:MULTISPECIES: ADP-ribosylglycohydrolase family protein [Nocardiopsidaceae]|uniref:ADP-ribosylglycohydrolase family protein n=1 Tax=Streptomonospora nanhaiensis TaxID=1323731 RepID=A0ABY6YN81_9ACTN|nr:ADP-ribosylglycohydrolase family protein [Streptomonospora nanhaiensis]WAE73612.1 ADP-ribosylglycohydrolase family protein [Streptomonospora nanhaiensis]
MNLPPPGSADDRAAGVLLGAACGDALGVPYEFGPALAADHVPRMVGGGLGPYAPGEYSDDTQMAVCIALTLRDHADPLSDEALCRTADAFLDWARDGASDIGNQTSAVMRGSGHAFGTPRVAEVMARFSAQRFEEGVRSAGNGSLMRTGPLALAYLDDPDGLAVAADRYSRLTHGDPLASEACVLWCEGVRHAVVHGDTAGVRGGLELLSRDRRGRWSAWLDEAEEHPPHFFGNNGFVVSALQAAWSAVVGEPDGFVPAVRAAVRAGNDTDTVAAIAGALLGARWGASAIPAEYLEAVHGWPGYRAEGLAELALGAVSGPDGSRGRRRGGPPA